jgi:Cu(I)/Ag(I) efflux system periplasmic protein CusF
MTTRRTNPAAPADPHPMRSPGAALRAVGGPAAGSGRRHVLRGALAAAFAGLAMAAAIGPAGPALAQGTETQGEVTRIDKAGGRIGIRHGGIAHLDMPPMTMTFRVRDTQALDRLAVGDRVRFVADRVDGQFVITRIAKVG